MPQPRRRNGRIVFDRVIQLPRRSFVAAICYREGEQGLEFLLVQTRAGRWVFPKGAVERGESYAMAAAREAQEEAGVLGDIDTRSFATFRYEKHVGLFCHEITVEAFLCRVFGMIPPAEDFREPAWFSAAQAKEQLTIARSPRLARELHNIVDRATAAVLWRKTRS